MISDLVYCGSHILDMMLIDFDVVLENGYLVDKKMVFTLIQQ